MILVKYQSVQLGQSYAMSASKYEENLQLICARVLKKMYETWRYNQQLEKNTEKLTVNILNKTKIIDVGIL